MIFFSTPRGSPAKGLPSAVLMSQISLATRLVSSPQGKIWKVPKSGVSSISDSSIRTNPSIEEPSNMISPARAFSNCDAGISTVLLMPRMSVNCSRRKRTLLEVARSRMSLAEAPDVSGSWERCRGIGFNVALQLFFCKFCTIARLFLAYYGINSEFDRSLMPFLQFPAYNLIHADSHDRRSDYSA